MEGQKFEINEDPSQILPERSVAYGPNLVDFVFEKFQNSGKKKNSRGDLGQHRAEKSSKQMLD